MGKYPTLQRARGTWSPGAREAFDRELAEIRAQIYDEAAAMMDRPLMRLEIQEMLEKRARELRGQK